MNHAPAHVVSAWIEAHNDHDLEADTALNDYSATNTQWPWDSTQRGREAMRATFERTFAAFPNIHLVADHLMEAGDGVAMERTFGRTVHGAAAGHAPTGLRFNLRGCEALRVREGWIVEQRGYGDKVTMFEQLGLHRTDRA